MSREEEIIRKPKLVWYNCNGWIKKGTEKAIRANTGRDRLTINGVCNVTKIEVIIHEDVSVNTQSTIALFNKMLVNQKRNRILLSIMRDAIGVYWCRSI